MSKRRLCAIMFTDIQGYTALMQEDEARAIEMRDRHREVFEWQHEVHHGDILQYFGDGTLSVFDSCVEAVRCAIGIQQELQHAPLVPLRLGIHLGDIIYSDEDVIGDGVNVASRVESMGTVGSIMISEDVAKQVQNHDISLVSMGKFRFKNVGHLMELFAVEAPGIIVPQPESLKGKGKRLGEIQFAQRSILKGILYGSLGILFVLSAFLGYSFFTNNESNDPENTAQEAIATNPLESLEKIESTETILAILPFSSLGEEKELRSFAQGMKEDISIGLSKLDSLSIINVPSQSGNIPDELTQLSLAKEKGIHFVLLGSVKPKLEGFQLNMRLLDVTTGNLKWGESFEGEEEELYSFQENIRSKVEAILFPYVDSMFVQDFPDPIHSPGFPYLLRAQNLFESGNLLRIDTAISLGLTAITLDSNLARAHGITSLLYAHDGLASSAMSYQETRDIATPFALKGLEILVQEPFSLTASGFIWHWLDWNLEKAEEKYRAAFPVSHPYLSILYSQSGDFDQAVSQALMGMADNPLSSHAHYALGTSYFYSGDLDSAVRVLKDGLEQFPLYLPMYHQLATIYWVNNNPQSAITVLEAGMEKRKDRDMVSLAYLARAHEQMGEIRASQALIDTLIARQETQPGVNSYMALVISLAEKNPIQAFTYLDKAMSAHEPGILWLKVSPMFEPLRGNTRYDGLLQQIGL